MAQVQEEIRTNSSEKKQYRPHNESLDSSKATDGGGNVGNNERLVSAIIGGGLLLSSLTGRSGVKRNVKTMIAMALLSRAASGYCLAYRALGVNTHDRRDTSSLGRRKVHTDRAVKVEQSIIVHRTPHDLFHYWRRVENLPNVMRHLRSVVPINDHQSHWIVDTLPYAPAIEWDAEIINEVEDERIGWRTLKGAIVDHAGSVVFQSLDGGSTKVTVTLQYDPPAGPLGAALAELLGQDPAKTIRDDLSRFKKVMEQEAIHA
jgi:uncharacterized membrane protein